MAKTLPVKYVPDPNGLPDCAPSLGDKPGDALAVPPEGDREAIWVAVGREDAVAATALAVAPKGVSVAAAEMEDFCVAAVQALGEAEGQAVALEGAEGLPVEEVRALGVTEELTATEPDAGEPLEDPLAHALVLGLWVGAAVRVDTGEAVATTVPQAVEEESGEKVKPALPVTVADDVDEPIALLLPLALNDPAGGVLLAQAVAESVHCSVLLVEAVADGGALNEERGVVETAADRVAEPAAEAEGLQVIVTDIVAVPVADALPLFPVLALRMPLEVVQTLAEIVAAAREGDIELEVQAQLVAEGEADAEGGALRLRVALGEGEEHADGDAGAVGAAVKLSVDDTLLLNEPRGEVDGQGEDEREAEVQVVEDGGAVARLLALLLALIVENIDILVTALPLATPLPDVLPPPVALCDAVPLLVAEAGFDSVPSGLPLPLITAVNERAAVRVAVKKAVNVIPVARAVPEAMLL